MAAALVAGALRRGRAGGARYVAETTLRRLVSTLVVAEHEGGLVKPSSLSALTAAEAIAKENKVSLLLAGSGPKLHKAAEHAASSHPLVNEVLVADSDVFAHPLAEPWAELLCSVQQKGGYSHVIASSTSFGKNLLPRAAALLDVSPVTDVTAISEPWVFVRPIYAGNALCTVRYTGENPCMMSIRSTSFSPTTESMTEAKVAPITQVDLSFLSEASSRKSSWVNLTSQDTERPDLANARVVVTGGRGLKSAENFKLLEQLAEKLGAAGFHRFIRRAKAAMEARPPPTPELPTHTQGDMVSPTVRTPIRTILGAIDAHDKKRVIVGGWVRTGRKSSSALAFLELNDGSCQQNLQAVVKGEVYELLRRLTPTGTSVYLEGVLEALDGAKHKQLIELKVERVIEIGEVDARFYPLPKTKHSLEGLRDLPHLRARTDTIAAVARIRSELAFATYIFFRGRGFWQVHTPVISTSDCEGAGEMFQVTTLFSQAEKVEKELKEKAAPSEADIEAAKLVAREKGDAIAQLKAAKATKQEIRAAVLDLEKAKENLSILQAERLRLTPGIPRKEDGTISFENDFFKRPAFLTVSGQLQAETYASALGNVYTFGPTFRAENSHTSRHLAEFWMVEPEMAFADLEDDMNCAESYVQHLCKWILEHCRQEMEFMVKHSGDSTAIERLELVSATPFERITYTKAVEILEHADKEFENKVEWGIDLSSEHERYLTDVVFKKPVIVYNYPKEIKAFYMRLNDDQKTVAAMDVLVPKVGELIGGSQREERLDILKQRINDGGLALGQYEWYLDLRRFGSVKHSGFGMGFERMLLFATGLDNIRDVIPFPRSPGKADL